MKALIYFEGEKAIKKSGIGRAMSHQLRALKSAGVSTCISPKEDEYDLAHINTVYAASKKLLKNCKKKGIPVIVHGHSTYEDFRNSFSCWQLIEPFFDRMLTYMYSHADLIITPTPYSKRLIEGYGLGPKVIDISNGIDLSEYAPDPEGVKMFRERFSLKDDEKPVIGIGFPFERKGIIDFFEVARSMPDTKFIWFGHLAKIATNAKIRRAIRKRPKNAIMAGYCAGKIIHGALQSSLCLFFPSHEETEGIVVLEALASHCPLIVRDIGVYEDWLHDGIDCHKGKTNDDFIRLINELKANGEKQEILDNGYALAKERTLDKVGLQLKKAYEELLASKK